MMYLGALLVSMTALSWLYWIYSGITNKDDFTPPVVPLLWTILLVQVLGMQS